MASPPKTVTTSLTTAMSEHSVAATALNQSFRRDLHRVSIGNTTSTTTGRRPKARKKKSTKYQSFEDLQSMVDADNAPQDLAAEGKLDELRSFIEKFDLTLKETDQYGATLLHHAAANNQVAVMQYLIESGIDINALDRNGNTALHLAVKRNHIEALHLLLDSGASDTILNKKGNAPLHDAATGENIDVLDAFLEHEVDMTVPGYRSRTPLHSIAEVDNLEGCKLFHEVAAQKKGKLRLCASDDDGLTPAHLAARKNSHRVLDFLMSNCRKHGYPVETILGFLDEENSTPLHAAVDRGNTEVVQVLLKHGASPLVVRDNIIPPLHLACSQGRVEIVQVMAESTGKEILLELDQNGRTPLHYCAYSIHSSCIVDYIAQQGIEDMEVDGQDKNGYTALHAAIKVGNLAVVKKLLSCGASPCKQDSRGENALHIAVRRNRKAIISELLDRDCVSNLCTLKNHNGFTPIHFALRMGYGDLISSMLASIKFRQYDVKDRYGNSYLHLAAASGNWKAMTTILDGQQKNLNETNNRGSTPLHFAAKNGHLRCVQILLNSGAMVHKCACGMTPLMLACVRGNTDCARLLYEAHPFQIDWKDDCGNTALHYAAKSRNPCMVTLILNLGCLVTHDKQYRSFFDLVISAGDRNCAMAVIHHPRWQECLDFISPSHPHPMAGLIQHMPDVAKAILDRCHKTASGMSVTHPDYWESFNFKYLQCRRRKVSEDQPNQLSEQTEEKDGSLSVPLISIHYKGNTHRRQVTSNTSEKGSVPTMGVLKTMMKFRRVDLLIHPVVEAYLKAKWRNYGRPIYVTSYSVLLLLVILLSAFILVVPNPNVQQTKDITHLAGNLSNTENNTSVNGEPTASQLSHIAHVLRVLILILNTLLVFHLFMNVVGLGFRSLNFVRYISQWIYALAIVFNYVFLLAPNPMDIWPIGSLACFFSWFMLVLAMEFFDVFGIYVKMFITIMRTAFQVLVICLFLLMAFAYSFYILAGNLTPFSSVGYSLFTLFGYMLGEIPYSAIVDWDREGLEYGNAILILVVVVAIVMTIVMANLLIGLAVGDIERIKLNAVLELRATEIEFYSTIDRALPHRLLNHFNKQYYRRYPAAQVSLVRQVWRELWRSVKDDLISNVDTTVPSHPHETHKTGIEDNTKELVTIKEQLLELTDTVQQMTNGEHREMRRPSILVGNWQTIQLSMDDSDLQELDYSPENENDTLPDDDDANW